MERTLKESFNTSSSQRELVIGILGPPLYYQHSRKVFQTLKKYADEQNIALHYFSNHEMKEYKDYYYEGNILHQFISNKNIHGLIVISNLIIDKLSIEKFIEKISYPSLPLVSTGIDLPGIPSVIMDNIPGVYEAVEHLIKVHHRKKIGFFKGLEHHHDAIERYQAYTRVMKNNHLNINPELVLQGDFSAQNAFQVISDFLDNKGFVPGEDIDAMVCANDYIAIETLNACQNRGYKVPDDIAVVGFDNIIQTSFQVPPLSSIENPIIEMSKKAIELILDLIKNKTVPDCVKMTSKFIPRDTCGCEPKKTRSLSSSLIDDYHKMSQINPGGFTEFFNRIIGSSSGHVIGPWQKALNLVQDYDPWKDIGEENDESQLKNKPLLDFARISYLMIKDIAEDSLKRLDYDVIFNSFRAKISATLDFRKMINLLKEDLPKLGIQRCCLCLYENYKDYNKPGKIPPHSDLVMAFYHEKGQFIQEDILEKGISFPTLNFLPDKILKKYSPMSWIINALFYDDQQIGYILFDHHAPNTNILYDLKALLSSRLRSVLLLNEFREQSQSLAKANTKIQILVDQLQDENLRITAEMAIASNLQTSLLPQDIKNIHPDFEIASSMNPATEVGGDYYNIMRDDYENLWIGIGDVSGHGLNAGLTMMIAYVVQMATTLNKNTTPRDAILGMNNILFKTVTQRLKQNLYMTCVLLKYLENGSFQYAGIHLDFLIYREKEKSFEEISQNGIWLNVLEDINETTNNREFTLNRGDIMILYTDGFTEIRKAGKQMLGIEGFKKIILSHVSEEINQMVSNIKDDILTWSEHSQDDDMSLILVKRIN